ncbi:hypothetical protein Tco_0950920 [Tanacetum coccineum]|uniref:CCHC-type domain-containing protein n=1 Tax=Tanacetum coccineum TaxID=301880 RepID=A0ABQ5DT34_9ASTR
MHGEDKGILWLQRDFSIYVCNMFDTGQVIQNGNSKKRISTRKDGIVRILSPVTAAEIQVVEKERKAKNILLMAIPKEHMRRFHGMDDVKEIMVLEAHGAEVSTEDANHKFLKSLPPEWSNLAMTMRTKLDVDTLSIDDMYNNLRGEHTEVEETNHATHGISAQVVSGDYTPTPQEEIDESLYVYGKKGPQEPEPNVSDDRSSEYSTCQSNDSAGSIGTSSEHSVDPESEISSVPPEVYVSTPITTNEKGVSDPKSKEVEPSCVSHIKTPRQPIKDQATPKVNRKNWNAMMERELGEGYSFTKKKCFVCGSLSHLIKDCDYYEKKMAREAEFKKQRVFNTGNRVAKPVWTNANRVNHANQFVPKPVQLNGGRPNANSVRPNVNTGRVNVNSVRSNVNTGRTNVNPVRPTVNTGSSNVNTVRSRQPVPTKTSNSFSPKRPQVNLFNQRRHFSKSHSSVRRPFAKITAQMSHSHAVKENWGSAVKTSAGYNWRNSKPHSNYDSGPTFFRTVNAKGPQGRPKPVKAWVLRKPDESAGFAEIVDCLRGSNLRYALTYAPIRNKLQLADASGITMMRNNEIFEGMGNMRNKGKIGGQGYSRSKMRVYVSQPPGFVDPDHPKKVYKVVKLCMDCIKLLELDIKKFDLVIVKTAINPWRDQSGRLQKDKEAVDVDVHLYRSMIGTDKSDIHINKQSKRASTDTESEESKRCQRIKAKPESQASFKQFWQTATANTLADGTLELHATIDPLCIQSLRHLLEPKLSHMERCSGIYNVKNFLMWPQFNIIIHQFQYHYILYHQYIFINHTYSYPAYTPTPILIDPEPMEHTFEEPSPAHQHFSPPQEHAQGQRTLDYLFQVVPQLMTKIDSLEKDLKQTKLTMGSAIVKLVKKVKKMEGILKRRNVVLSDSEEEESEAQGRKSQDDPLVSLVQGLGRRYKRRKETKGKKVVTSLDFQEKVSTRYAEGINTVEGVNTGSIKVSTVSRQVSTDSIKKSIPSSDKGQREGKAPMIIEEAPKMVCKAMLDKKLQGGKPDEDCYKLLKWMEKQAGIRK